MDKITHLPQEALISLALLKKDVELAGSKLETAKQQYELSLLTFKYNLLTIYRKFDLPEDCQIKDDGTIVYSSDETPM